VSLGQISQRHFFEIDLHLLEGLLDHFHIENEFDEFWRVRTETGRKEEGGRRREEERREKREEGKGGRRLLEHFKVKNGGKKRDEGEKRGEKEEGRERGGREGKERWERGKGRGREEKWERGTGRRERGERTYSEHDHQVWSSCRDQSPHLQRLSSLPRNNRSRSGKTFRASFRRSHGQTSCCCWR
jgi:hypothetical protein